LDFPGKWAAARFFLFVWLFLKMKFNIPTIRELKEAKKAFVNIQNDGYWIEFNPRLKPKSE